MRRIAVVGAGQAGLQLALGLQAAGHQVTVVAARTAEQVRSGRVLSTQAMFGPALRIEREAGLNGWEREAPACGAVSATVAAPPGVQALSFVARLDDPAQSIDQRVKTAGWLELFEERGGRVEIREVDGAGLRRLAAAHELTVVAAGRGELAEVFGRDVRRSRYDRPQRTLAAIYLHGVSAPESEAELSARIHALPEVGELVLQPGLTTSGPCTILLFEAVPGGSLDVFRDHPGPAEQLARTLELLRTHVPWEYELCAGAEPTDAGCNLYGAITPVVRHPVARLDDGVHVLGLADTVVLNDPISAQGANNAARAAASCRQAILDRGDAPFTPAWMRDTSAIIWQHARHSVEFTATMLAVPAHVQRVFAAAQQHEAVARRFAATFADPADHAHWLATPDRTDAYLTAVAAG